MTITNLRRSLQYEIRIFNTKFPLLHIFFLRWGRNNLQKIVNHDTEMVIDGFPRTANSFVFNAFATAQGAILDPKNMPPFAHHSHAAAQIIWAVRQQIPTLVLIREPKDTIFSFHIRTPSISIYQIARGYISFYRALMDYREHFLIGEFNAVTTDLGKVIERVNQKFSTTFVPFDHTEENAQEIFTMLNERWKTYPYTKKARTRGRDTDFKAKQKEILEQRTVTDKKFQDLLNEAKSVYQIFLS